MDAHSLRMRRTSIPAFPASAFPAEQLAATPHLRAVVAETPARPVLSVESTRPTAPHLEQWSLRSVILLLSLWAAIFLAASATPSLLDDADATHSQAAQAMLHTGDWVTLHVNGIRFLEKPPLPYWIAASCMRLFGENTFAVHLPLALTILGLALLGYAWGRRALHTHLRRCLPLHTHLHSRRSALSSARALPLRRTPRTRHPHTGCPTLDRRI